VEAEVLGRGQEDMGGTGNFGGGQFNPSIDFTYLGMFFL